MYRTVRAVYPFFEEAMDMAEQQRISDWEAVKGKASIITAVAGVVYAAFLQYYFSIDDMKISYLLWPFFVGSFSCHCWITQCFPGSTLPPVCSLSLAWFSWDFLLACSFNDKRTVCILSISSVVMWSKSCNSLTMSSSPDAQRSYASFYAFSLAPYYE